MLDQDWTYVGDVCVGVSLACNCDPAPEPDCPDGGMVFWSSHPHEAHDLIEPRLEEDLPEGWTMEDWRKACKLAATAPRLLKACQTVVEGYEGDGMEDMRNRDEVFYRECKAAIAEASETL